MTCESVRETLRAFGAALPLEIAWHPPSDWYTPFDGKLRDELLDRELFDTLLEAKVLIERWRRHCDGKSFCENRFSRTLLGNR